MIRKSRISICLQHNFLRNGVDFISFQGICQLNQLMLMREYRTQDEDDKLMRYDAKLVYVRLCKMKAKQYGKLQTTDLLNAKYSDSRSYWKMIKPVTKTTSVVPVKPEEFRSYF